MSITERYYQALNQSYCASADLEAKNRMLDLLEGIENAAGSRFGASISQDTLFCDQCSEILGYCFI